jgi:arylformamidase
MARKDYLRITNSMRLHLSTSEWIDTNKPLDISIPIINNSTAVKAWYVDDPRFEPVRANGFVGSVKEGGSVNFRDIFFNPHGHGTHTECLGHITKEVYSINSTLTSFFCKAQLITIDPVHIEAKDGKLDRVILLEQLEACRIVEGVEAIIIRTLPNPSIKRSFNYSSANAPYLAVKCIDFFDAHTIQHLLIDTPSVDREEDGGELAFHHAFWKVPEQPDHTRTITELIFVDDSIPDGEYVLELQVAAFINDAAPSRPVLYQIEKG